MKKQIDVTLLTVESYVENAQEYIKNTDQLSYFPGLQQWLDKFIDLLPGPDVLDIAFGSGRDILYMYEHNLKVQGIELVDEFISTLRQKINVPLYKMDMRDLDFDNELFDGIWCCSAFLHIQKRQALSTLKGFNRILRTNGLIFLSLKLGNGYEWKIEGNISTHKRYFSYYTIEEITELLSKVGMKIVATSLVTSRRKSHIWLSLIAQKSKKSESDYG